jgi:hypothetical protein
MKGMQSNFYKNFRGHGMAKKKPQLGGAREGAGRPVENAEGKTITIAASVPEGLVADLKARAAAEGWSLSRAVTEAIRGLLAKKKRR